jgi:1-phosphofructokinase
MIVTVTLNPAVDKVYWVDRVKFYEDTQEEFLTPAVRSATSAGGKGVNMSVFLSQMGVENVAMGFVGGHTGHVVVRDLRDRGVTTNFVWTTGETRTNVTVLEKGRTHVPIFIDEAGSAVNATEVDRFFRRYRRMLKRATWIVLGGSLPPGVDAGIYYELAKLARDAGVKAVLSAGGEALSRAVEACPDLVKPDTRSHRELMGIELVTRDSIIDAGKRLVSCGAGMVVISHEVTGDIAVTKDSVWEIRTAVPTSELKNLVGADDVFLAGILYKLAEDADVEEALRFGLAAGLASAESEDKVCKDLARIEQEMASITVERI